jgi:hypothetical protein
MERELIRATSRTVAGRVFVALWGGLAVVDLARPAGGGLFAGTLVVALVAACGVGQSVPGAAAIAATGWLVINGFVLHRYGELGFGAASRWALVLVLAIGLVVAAGTARATDRR